MQTYQNETALNNSRLPQMTLNNAAGSGVACMKKVIKEVREPKT